MELYKRGLLYDNCIEITPEIVSIFRKNWNKIVEETRDRKFSLSFFHLRTSPFWKLIPNRGYELAIDSIPTVKSLSQLKEIVFTAEIDAEFVELLIKEESREKLTQYLLDEFFPDSQENYFTQESNPFQNIELEIEPDTYKKKLLNLRETADKNEFQEEIFIRSGAFKRMIIQNYNDSCAISGMQLTATANVSILDACHIVPFAESYDDTPSNGIALNPTLHRAFDRGLISISDDYKVLVNDSFIENNESPFNLSQFKSETIQLPRETKFYPSLTNLRDHRKRYGF